MNTNQNLHDVNVREPAVAGQFYPSDKKELERFIEHSSQKANLTLSQERVRAIISPHAGFVYSGSTAAMAFANIKNKVYENVIVLAPSHRIPFRGIALSSHTHYKTPLGNIPVNQKAVRKILKNHPAVSFLRNDAHDGEHSLETQLPFIQKFLPNSSLIPIICGHIDNVATVVDSLKTFWNKSNLWVISSDFTHYGKDFHYTPFVNDLENSIEKLDMQAINLILSLQANKFDDYLEKSGATICGASPISILLHTIASMENIKLNAKLINYTNSGRLSGDFSHCVSYASIVFFDRQT